MALIYVISLCGFLGDKKIPCLYVVKDYDIFIQDDLIQIQNKVKNIAFPRVACAGLITEVTYI